MADASSEAEDPLLLACRELSREMDLFDEAAARALGIGRNDLRALNLLERGPLSAATIADRLSLTRAGVTALVDRLESARLVRRTSVPEDRRVVMVGLEPATWRAFADVYRPLGHQVRGAVGGGSEGQHEVLRSGLSAVAGAFRGAREQLDAGLAPRQ